MDILISKLQVHRRELVDVMVSGSCKDFIQYRETVASIMMLDAAIDAAKKIDDPDESLLED